MSTNSTNSTNSTLRKLDGIYAITPVVDTLWNMDSVLDCSEAVLSAGVQWVQLRQKNLDPVDWLEMAYSLGLLCQKYQANLILNDAPPTLNWLEIPALAGVHLGKEDWSVREARSGLPAGMVVGASCYNQLQTAQAQVAAGASYIAFGAIYESGTKPLAVRADLALFEQAKPLGVPMVAIGGITLDKLPELRKAGADAVAVVGGLFGQNPDAVERVEDRAIEWIEAWRDQSV
ncbi:MAG: thiamine phosphate synthase [Limnobacter sp.]|nr:thiamine phosphate synthase [Limnobacter sp.]